MNEETTNASVTNTDVQSTENEQKDVAINQNKENPENAELKNVAKTEIKDKDEQSTPTTTEDKTAVDSPVAPSDKTTETKPTETHPNTPTEPKIDPATPVKPAQTQTTEQTKKLADVVPTTLVWISGVVGSHQIDCAGPIELPFKLDKPEWPYTTVAPNSNYTNQVFDYDSDTWVATDAKSQGQMLTDLSKKVETLQEDSASHEKSADQTQKMGMQLTQAMTILTTKMTTMEGKLDTLLNTKDGDK